MTTDNCAAQTIAHLFHRHHKAENQQGNQNEMLMLVYGTLMGVSNGAVGGQTAHQVGMSGFGYNLPLEPPLRHVCNGPRFGHSGRDVRFDPIFVCFPPRCGHS